MADVSDYFSPSEIGPAWPHLAPFIACIAERTGLSAAAQTFPLRRPLLAVTADAVAAASRDLLDWPLSLDESSIRHFDRFIGERLLPRKGGKRRKPKKVPGSALLHYALGAFYGEWLARRRSAHWVECDAVQPIQASTDAISTTGAILYPPFTHVTKALLDLDGDGTFPKVTWERTHLPALLVAELDAPDALAPLGAPARAISLAEAGEADTALDLLTDEPEDACALDVAYGIAISRRYLDAADAYARLRLERHRSAHGCFALCEVLRSTTGIDDEVVALLEEALTLDPKYEAARLALANVTANLGNPAEALEMLAGLVEAEDPGTQDEANALREEIERRR